MMYAKMLVYHYWQELVELIQKVKSFEGKKADLESPNPLVRLARQKWPYLALQGNFPTFPVYNQASYICIKINRI